MARRDGRLADVDVTGVLDLVVGGGALHPAPLLGNRNVTRRLECPCEIFPVPLLGSRAGARRRKGPREIFVVARRAGGGAFVRPVPRLLEAQSGDARMQAKRLLRGWRSRGRLASLHIPASL